MGGRLHRQVEARPEPARVNGAERRALQEVWAGRSAHADLEGAIADLDPALRGVRPEGLPYSVWELVEHIRIGQEDLVAYTLDATHASPAWPDGYWPEPSERVEDAVWNESVAGLRRALEAMEAWLTDPNVDLGAEIAHSDELPGGGRRTPLRQVLVALDHRAYHLGQIVVVRRALGAW